MQTSLQRVKIPGFDLLLRLFASTIPESYTGVPFLDQTVQTLTLGTLEFIIHILSGITGASHGPGIQNGHPTRI